MLAGQAAMMRRHPVLAKALRQVTGQTLGEAARINKDQGTSMLPHQVGKRVV